MGLEVGLSVVLELSILGVIFDDPSVYHVGEGVVRDADDGFLADGSLFRLVKLRLNDF